MNSRSSEIKCELLADHNKLSCLARRYELGRQPASTKLSSNVAVRSVRVRGGNSKFRALRLDTGNFAWGSEVSQFFWVLSGATVVANNIIRTCNEMYPSRNRL